MKNVEDMITVEGAQDLILSHVSPMPCEHVGILAAQGRAVVCDLTSDIDVAPFDNSAMDGFGCKASDTEPASADHPVHLKIVAHIGAGDVYDQELKPGQAVRIMTGAAIPTGVDAVEKIERCTYTHEGLMGDELVLDHPVPSGANVRYAGEDVHAGDIVMRAGSVVGPAFLGLLASTGNTSVTVCKVPRVGIISLGSELVEPDKTPGPGHIRGSNGHALAGCVQRAGCTPQLYPIVPDDEAFIKQTLARAISECDFVVSSGGASEGDFDFITQTAASLGKVFFKYVNMRPGKSQTFAMIDGTPFLGLAGNPAAAVVGFEMLAFPALMKMLGRTDVYHPRQTALLAVPVRKKDKRRNYQRATLARREDGQLTVTPDRNQSSALFRTFAQSDCLVRIPEGPQQLAEGTPVECVRLDIDAGTVI